MSKSLEKMRADDRVASVSAELPDGYFVYLAEGWHMSEQTSFGVETLKEGWKLVRASKYDPKLVEELKSL